MGHCGTFWDIDESADGRAVPFDSARDWQARRLNLKGRCAWRASIFKGRVARFGARACNAFWRGGVLRGKVRGDFAFSGKEMVSLRCMNLRADVQRELLVAGCELLVRSGH